MRLPKASQSTSEVSDRSSLRFHLNGNIYPALVITCLVLRFAVLNFESGLSEYSRAASNVVKFDDRNTTHGPPVSSRHIYRSANDTAYTWQGNIWIPPLGVPHYTGAAVRCLFRSENTIWVGDSTIRQEYHTLRSFLEAANPGNIEASEFVDGAFNPNLGHKIPFLFTARHGVSGSGDRCLRVRPKGPSEDPNATLAIATYNQDPSKHSEDCISTGRNDLYRLNCYRDGIQWIDQDLRKPHYKHGLRSWFSLAIISLGVWDTDPGNRDKCASLDRLEELLGKIEKEVSGPDLFVIWQAHAPASYEGPTNGAEALSLGNRARAWFLEHQPEHMDFIDLGSILVGGNRSFWPNRITGDHTAHYGFEARALGGQLVADALHRRQQRDGIDCVADPER